MLQGPHERDEILLQNYMDEPQQHQYWLIPILDDPNHNEARPTNSIASLKARLFGHDHDHDYQELQQLEWGYSLVLLQASNHHLLDHQRKELRQALGLLGAHDPLQTMTHEDLLL